MIPTPISEEANDDDHEASDQVTTEHRNRTLLDMVRYMMSLTDLPLSFLGLCIRDSCIHVKKGTI